KITDGTANRRRWNRLMGCVRPAAAGGIGQSRGFAMSRLAAAVLALVVASPAVAGVGDPQVRTDDPWYPGELACSTFDRLFATEAEVYTRVTGRACTTDEDKVLAAWLWRNTHYWHGEEGAEDYWGLGFGK